MRESVARTFKQIVCFIKGKLQGNGECYYCRLLGRVPFDVVYGNSGYLGAPERPEIINDETLSQVEFRINKPHENIQSTSLSFFICR